MWKKNFQFKTKCKSGQIIHLKQQNHFVKIRGKEDQLLLQIDVIFSITYNSGHPVKRRCSKLLHNAESCYLQ